MTSPTTPPAGSDGGMLAQILLKQGEMGTQLAVMNTKLDAIPDHETRIRELRAEVPPSLVDRLGNLETARARAVGAAVASGVLSSGAASLIVWALSRH